ncbi:hypothetical protein PM082_015348 [Marasmius tenuissimus]|nr:hypothetical protein PM082_015348 [Marasmius tenuissimus]
MARGSTAISELCGQYTGEEAKSDSPHLKQKARQVYHVAACASDKDSTTYSEEDIGRSNGGGREERRGDQLRRLCNPKSKMRRDEG